MAQADFLPNAIRTPITGVHPSSSTRSAHAELVAVVEGQSPLPVLHHSGIENSAEHRNKLITSLPVHVTGIIDDTARNMDDTCPAGSTFAKLRRSFPTSRPT
jgi:hypothetical protein